MSDKSKVDSFYKFLISNGYYFDKDLIENYLLSLKVKPFEILTGNSGTGKTKLSQLFAKFINGDIKLKKEDINDKGYFTLKVKTNYSSWENNGWTLQKDEISSIIPINECGAKFDMVVDDISAKGDIKTLVQLYYDSEKLKQHFKDLYEKNPNGSVDLKISCDDLKEFISKDYIKPNGSILLKQKSNQSAFEKRQWFAHKNIFNYYPFDSGYSKCNVIVDGIKSTAKLRITPKITYKKNDELQNYLKDNDGKEVDVELKIKSFDFEDFISDWDCSKSRKTESLDVECADSKYIIVPVGANWTDNTNIVGYYNVITEDYQPTPAYKLIKQAQDDPNHPYFLILDEMNLSHVERYFADFLSAIESYEEIPLYGNNESLNLPDNLFTIGTVNVDETTYMFSPKVLDRANTIEFETLTAWDYMVSDTSDDDFKGNIDYLQSPLIDSEISNLNIDDLKQILSNINYNGDTLWETLAMELTVLQENLKDSSFDFGFRVINEILRFMIVAWRYAKNFDINKNNCRYYTSALKLQNMSKVLSDQRYVSFIN